MDLRVPFIPDAHIEQAAAELARKYGAWKGESEGVRPPINVDEIVEGFYDFDLGMDHLAPLLGVEGILGATWLEQGRMLIDSSLEGREGRLAFTVAHEVGHLVLHRPLIEAAKLELPLFPLAPGATPTPAVVCRESGKHSRAEMQADAFAACLLMPAAHVRAAVRTLYGDALPAWEGVEARRQAREYDPQLKALAAEVITAGAFSNCSNEAMRYRLLGLKLVRDTSAPQGSLF